MNHLSKEKSPYLLQHQHNPVNWYAWGEDAFAAAKKANKPIFLSIGYSTCYWCHVMEKECFEDNEVAEVLNAHFISIKVDREERPDVDNIYMDAVVALTSRGGWPMSVFLTPDLKPFWGGTYFPKPNFLQILAGINNAWENEPEKITEQSTQLTDALSKVVQSHEPKDLGDDVLINAFQGSLSRFDEQDGGFGKAPKFPPSQQVKFLLRYYKRSGSKEALKMAVRTLDRMARGGIYDHLGGGFSRYSTDEKWLVPHFEKMLYDNGLLASAYVEASVLLKQEGSVEHAEMFESVAREIFAYIKRDMTHSSGAFYSAEDAGEVDKEGEFYVWKYNELKSLLTDDELKRFAELYSVTKQGNFEHGHNVLSFKIKESWAEKGDPLIVSAHKKLLAARDKRERPHLDDKILTSWNAMMITALAEGYQAFGDAAYLDMAAAAADFLLSKLYKDGKLLRRFRDGEAKINGFAEDYAYFIEALISLYESDFDPKWLKTAVELQQTQDKLFWDQESGGYFYTTAAEMVVKQKEIADGATPSANSVSFMNLVRLAAFFPKSEFPKRVGELAPFLSNSIARSPLGFSKSLHTVDFLNDSSKEIVIVISKDTAKQTAVLEFRKYFIPNSVITVVEEGGAYPDIAGKKKLIDGKRTFYICEDQMCKLPTTEVAKALELARKTEELK